MATIEQVEKLREKANVTYDEAKAALDASNGDLLDAIIYLERQGKVKAPKNDGYYQSGANSGAEQKEEPHKAEKEPYTGARFSELVGRFIRWCGKMLHLGNINSFEVIRNNNVMISVPINVLILLLIFAFPMVLAFLIIGLFMGCRYLFKGPNIENTGVNHMMDSAADAAENLKNEIKGDGDKK